ncbi:hypothetical protein NC652_018304 [Populus alba x Populus x berolinensis]|nr:hypothetical protein NC652_018304 [Populus alba x Populus x berolinensis]
MGLTAGSIDEYESFVLYTCEDSGGSFLEESDSECWRDGRAGIEEGSKEKEGNFVVFTVIFFRNKINEAKKPKPRFSNSPCKQMQNPAQEAGLVSVKSNVKSSN